MENNIKKRIEAMRFLMKKNKIDYYVLEDKDPHLSEYVDYHYRLRTLFTGFDGSNGTLLLGQDDAYLWTDGRYFIQASKQLEGTGITLMRMGEKDVPSFDEFIGLNVPIGRRICFFSLTVSKSTVEKVNRSILKNAMNNQGGAVAGKENIKNMIVMDEGSGMPYTALEMAGCECKPLLPGIITIPDENLFTLKASDKIRLIKQRLINNHLGVYVVPDLAQNMYLFNLRGSDIEKNPLAFSYSVFTKTEAYLYVYSNVITKELMNYAADNGFVIRSYDDFYKELIVLAQGKFAGIDSTKCTDKLFRILSSSSKGIVDTNLDIPLDLAIKGEKEIANLRDIYKIDSAVLAKFLNEMKEYGRRIALNPIGAEYMNEYDAMCRLDMMRLANKECFDLSFTTISAFGPNGAMMHYESTESDNSRIDINNLYLVDSGGQYFGGTTDVTRTIAIGEPTYEMKHDYTKVVRGMLALQNAVWLEGCTGINLDILARLPMWEEGDDYKCGTGHGVGYMLSVHEGPHAIRWRNKADGPDTVLKPGMLVSDEPGIYKEGKYGIRMENILLVKEKCQTADGTFLCFECLTYVPVDMDLIIPEEMNDKELKWLYDYQNKCIEVLG